MEKVLLSFIIPMYNAEKYIEKCIKSIESQNIGSDKYEIVVIDDGSTDSGGNLVKQHGRVRYYRQENSGQSAARNKGIELANGDFICFVDADDVLVPDSLGFCLNTVIEQSLDMITFEMIVCPNNWDITTVTNQSNDIESIISGAEYIERYNFNNGPCWYLIRKESLGGLRFVNERYGEDGMFTMELLMKIKRIAHVPRKCYCYVRHPNTTTTRSSVKHQLKMIDDYMYVYHHIQDLIERNRTILSEKAIERCKQRAESYIFFLLIRLMKYTGDKQLIREKVQELKSEKLYPIAKPYSGLRYDVVSVIVNHYPLLKIANFLYNVVAKRK